MPTPIRGVDMPAASFHDGRKHWLGDETMGLYHWGWIICGMALFGSNVFAGSEELSSGPPPGALLPRAFDALTLNGKIGKGRYHCLVCEFGLEPVVLIFAREHAEGHEKALEQLLEQLDQLLARAPYNRLHAAVVFLSPAARRLVPASPQAAKEATGDGQGIEEKAPLEKLSHEKLLQEADRLVREAKENRELLARLQPLAERLKQVLVAVYPESGPPDYHLAPQAEVTVLLYVKQQVTARFAFAAGKLTDKAVAQVLEKARALVEVAAPQPPEKANSQPRGQLLPADTTRTGWSGWRRPAGSSTIGTARRFWVD